ncbi:MAG: type II secretion system protein [Moritella sp.]|uniref:type II secretion system protein n=1 Tax=Moritella sp. TaxID=78556 RepID=UPI0029A3F159|nr:type II secretion system protein [Moritella sp.]MDX2319653.1 type II secretion system protein [Moritella sp.]
MDFTAGNKNNGFTLIELVITITVLGVLAATAVPRFIDVKDDAKKETVENFHGSLRAAVRLLHMKSQIENALGDDITIATDYGDYQFYRGYPETRSEATIPNAYFIETFLELGVPSDVTKGNDTRIARYAEISVYEDNDYSRIGYGSGNLKSNLCYAEYHHTSETQVFSLNTDGC